MKHTIAVAAVALLPTFAAKAQEGDSSITEIATPDMNVEIYATPGCIDAALSPIDPNITKDNLYYETSYKDTGDGVLGADVEVNQDGRVIFIAALSAAPLTVSDYFSSASIDFLNNPGVIVNLQMGTPENHRVEPNDVVRDVYNRLLSCQMLG